MAKSIFETLATLTTETTVQNQGEISHSIPAELFPTPEMFEDARALADWAELNGFTHALLQQGIQKGLIDIRAKFRATKKGETWSAETAQENVNSHKWTVITRPKTGKVTVESAVSALSKLSPEELAAVLAKVGK